MKEEQAAPEATKSPPERISKVENVLSPSTLRLLKGSPENETARTLALAACRRPLPDEAKTWEQIVEWIEHNIKSLGGLSASSNPSSDAVRVDGVYTHCAHGRANYKDKCQGIQAVKITVAELGQIIESGAATTWGSLVNLVVSNLSEKVYENPPNTIILSTEVTDRDEEDDGTVDAEVGISESAVSRALAQALRVHYPLTARELGV